MTDAMSIISGATVLFSREPNVCRVYSHEDEDGFVIIVGDIHGEFVNRTDEEKDTGKQKQLVLNQHKPFNDCSFAQYPH